MAIIPVQGELSGSCSRSGAAAPAYQAMLMADWATAHAGAGSIYSLFQEMEDKDAHLFATLQTRKQALLSCPVRVLPSADTPVAREAAAAVEAAIAGAPGFSGTLFHLLDAMAKGFAVAEIVWKVDGTDGRVGIEAIKARFQGDFAFDRAGLLYLVSQPAARSTPGPRGPAADLLPRPGESMLWHRSATPLPARKFLHFAFQGNACSPYGSGLCAKAYWYCWFKRNTMRHWALFNEKFGAPTAVARYGEDTTPDQLASLEETLQSLPTDSGVLLPDGVALEFLEARRSSGSNTYRELADWCNDELSKVVLGQTLTTAEGRRSGSYAVARVHEAVRRDYLQSDARALGEMLTLQLSRWITDFNFGPDAPAPSVVFDCADASDYESQLNVDRELVKLGVPLPASYFYDRYRRPTPQPGERSLRYDDANLYQYHLLYGVLTINEVRHTLGMPPVAWGDVPPARPAGEASGTGGRSPLDRPGRPRDGDLDELELEADEAASDRRIR